MKYKIKVVMVTVATWNVNSVKARLPHVLKWLKNAAPDVLLLQELKCVQEAFPFQEIEDLGYNVAVKGQKTYNGVAILSKSPLEDVVDVLPGDDGDEQARYIEAFTCGVRVASIYVPNGQEVGSEKFAYKGRFYQRLYDYIKQLLDQDEAFVLGGDYNVAPQPIDGYKQTADDRILCSLPEREWFHKLLHLGLTNALRDLNPAKEHLYSWWDYRRGSWEQNHGYLIDHLLLSPEAADRLEDGGVDIEPRAWEKASDHTPVWCKLIRDKN